MHTDLPSDMEELAPAYYDRCAWPHASAVGFWYMVHDPHKAQRANVYLAMPFFGAYCIIQVRVVKQPAAMDANMMSGKQSCNPSSATNILLPVFAVLEPDVVLREVCSESSAR